MVNADERGGGGKKSSNPFLDLFEGNLTPKKKSRTPSKAIPQTPKPKKNYSTAASSSSSSVSTSSSRTSSGTSSGTTGSRSSGGGGGGGGMSAAEKRAIARENAAKSKAANRFAQQSQHLEGQAAALRRALGASGYRHGLNIQLGNVGRVLAQQQATINTGYLHRLANLQGNLVDNAKAEGGQTAINTSNLVRERNSAVAEAMTHGAGESDVLNAQMMSLRNWNANQSEVLRSFYDSLRSVNTSLTDLNEDTKTALTNNDVQANADREQLWTNYHNQRKDTLIQLGNVRGQQADYLSQAGEMKKGAGKGSKGKAVQAKNAFMQSARETGMGWRNPGVSEATKNWSGEKPFEQEKTNASRLEGARTTRLSTRPEGATLRKW